VGFAESTTRGQIMDTLWTKLGEMMRDGEDLDKKTLGYEENHCTMDKLGIRRGDSLK